MSNGASLGSSNNQINIADEVLFYLRTGLESKAVGPREKVIKRSDNPFRQESFAGYIKDILHKTNSSGVAYDIITRDRYSCRISDDQISNYDIKMRAHAPSQTPASEHQPIGPI